MNSMINSIVKKWSNRDRNHNSMTSRRRCSSSFRKSLVTLAHLGNHSSKHKELKLKVPQDWKALVMAQMAKKMGNYRFQSPYDISAMATCRVRKSRFTN